MTSYIAHARMSMVSKEKKIRAFLHGSEVLVWTSEEVERLAKSWRILGGLIGAHPQQPHQNVTLGLPLVLLPEEVMLLLDHDVLEVQNASIEVCCQAGGYSRRGAPEGVAHSSSDQQYLSSLVDQSTPSLELGGSLSLHTLPVTDRQLLKFQVFQDLWKLGYYLTSGLKFGGDFLVYKKHPDHTHATYIAIVTSWQHPLDIRMGSLCKVAGQVRKRLLLCSVKDNVVHYLTLGWTKLQ